MAGEEVGERKGVSAGLETLGFGEECPGGEDCGFRAAVGAVFDDRLFGRLFGGKGHGKGSKQDGGIDHREQELAREERASGLRGGPVEDERR